LISGDGTIVVVAIIEEVVGFERKSSGFHFVEVGACGSFFRSAVGPDRGTPRHTLWGLVSMGYVVTHERLNVDGDH
jgi:hypothetical protein